MPKKRLEVRVKYVDKEVPEFTDYSRPSQNLWLKLRGEELAILWQLDS